ncbi:MAG: hypothetical protein M0Z49_16630 [Chloroflexi bacterium]|nr:hypothetical protein [Chloroflexota bacterium]
MRGGAWLGCLVVLAAVASGCGASTQGRVDAAGLQAVLHEAPAASPVVTSPQYSTTMCRLTNTLASAVSTLQAVDGRSASAIESGVAGLPAVLSRADRLFSSVEHWQHASSTSLAQPAAEVESLLSNVSPTQTSASATTRLDELVLRAAERDFALDAQGGQTTTGLTSRLVQAFATARVAIAQELGLPLPVQIPLDYQIACPPAA